MGEYGVPDDDPAWLSVLDAVLAVMDGAGCDGTYWSAGEFWGDYPLSVQPTVGFMVDRPQLPTLLNHLGACRVSAEGDGVAYYCRPLPGRSSASYRIG